MLSLIGVENIRDYFLGIHQDLCLQVFVLIRGTIIIRYFI